MAKIRLDPFVYSSLGKFTEVVARTLGWMRFIIFVPLLHLDHGMETRGNESPMDFEWQGHGPVDPTSPFHRHAMENQKKRPFSTFQTPQKPSLPSFGPPNSQPFFFSNVPVSAQPDHSQYRTPSFTKLRAPDYDFSSGPENSSPADFADNEDTPEVKNAATDSRDDATTPSKSKRNSLFNFYGKYAPPSAGRGEITSTKKIYSNKIEKRLHKRRRKAQDFQLALRRPSEDTNSSSDDGPGPTDKKRASKSQPPQEIGWMTGLFAFIHTYPDAPSIIAKYLQVFFNAAILAGCLYMFYSFYATIQGDVNRASEEAMAGVLAEMEACAKSFVENSCGSDRRAPALEAVCTNWEKCMNRDPSAVKRARLSAHTFAEIFNGFVEPISLKTMLFTSTLVILGLLVNNATFTMFRRSQEHHYADGYRQASGAYLHPPPPPALLATSARPQQLGWQAGYNQNWNGRQGGYQQGIEWNEAKRSPSKDHRGRSRSPEKRLLAR